MDDNDADVRQSNSTSDPTSKSCVSIYTAQCMALSRVSFAPSLTLDLSIWSKHKRKLLPFKLVYEEPYFHHSGAS